MRQAFYALLPADAGAADAGATELAPTGVGVAKIELAALGWRVGFALWADGFGLHVGFARWVRALGWRAQVGTTLVAPKSFGLLAAGALTIFPQSFRKSSCLTKGALL